MDYRILNSDLDIRIKEVIDTGVSGRRLEASQYSRQLVETASKSDPRLKDLYELDFELGN